VQRQNNVADRPIYLSWIDMNLEKYAHQLGRLHGNLASLEFALRAYLYAHADLPHQPLPNGMVLTSLRVGDSIPENALTDYSTLAQLISRYNRSIPASHAKLSIDPNIVDLRDALAHGRVASSDSEDDFFLLKFSKPSFGQTTITYSQQLSSAWLNQQIDRVRTELDKIINAPGSPLDKASL
jgi:hypothetical protein